MVHQETLQSQLPLDVEALVAYLNRQPDVVAVYLFGSVARERVGPRSDVDVAVLLRDGLSSEETFEQRLQLLGDLGSFSDREVDVVVLNTAPLLLQQQVLKYGRVIYERDSLDRIRFEVRARKTYFDVKPMFDYHSQELIRRIKEVGLGWRRRGHQQPPEAAESIR